MTDYNFGDNGAREMGLDSSDGEDDYELPCVGLVEMFKIFVPQEHFFYGTASFDGVYQPIPISGRSKQTSTYS